MSWITEIAAELQNVQNMVVRFNVEQQLDETQKARARDNIGIGATATQISGDDYRIAIK